MKEDNLEIILEDINSKFDLVLEGYSSLDKKIDDLARKTEERFNLVDFKFEVLNNKIDSVAADLKATDERLSGKIDAVAADLKAHRHDTEAHGGIYCVREK